jgi:phage-related minor tail protein
VAFRADIEIAVKGAQELKRLQNDIRVASDAVNSLNSNLSGIANLVPRSFDNLNKTVAQAAKSFNAAALGTQEATDAAREYIQATDTLNVGLRERVALLAKVRAEQRRTVPGDAGTGQQTPALPPQLIRTYEIGKNWVKFFQDAAQVAVDLRARSLNTQKNWNDFFATAAQAAVNVKANSLNTQKNWNDFFATAAQAAVNVKANSLNTQKNWNDFFATAAQAAVNVKANSLNTQKNWNDFFATAAQAAVNVKANSLNTQKNWNDFFATAAQAAVNVKANSLNTQKNWNDFFATAAQAAVNVKANSLNTQKNWNDFFATAAQAAVNVKANSVNTKNSWNTFFTEAAQLANDLTDRTREIEGKNSAAARDRLAADAERRRNATPEVIRRPIAGLAAPEGMGPVTQFAQLGTVHSAVKAKYDAEMQFLTTITNIEREFDKQTNYLEIQAIQRELDAELDKIEIVAKAQKAADTAALKDFDARLKTRTATKGAAAKASSDRTAMMQNALIGGAFPMLFGGGAGAVLGGAAGGFIPGNPMMSVVTSALGTVVDQFAAAATEMGASLRDPITNFEKLKETNLFASKAQEFYIQKLIETGRITEATGAIQEQIIRKVGVAGFNDLTKLAEASTRLTKELAGVTEQAQALTAGPLSGILNFLTDMLKLSNEFVKLNAETLAPLFKLLFGAGDTKPTTPPPVKIDPATQEQAIKAAEQVADTIKGAYRTGFQLQQQALDLQRQGTDLQRRVADDIFNKQQQIARLQIDNERQRQQIAIETVDLEYRRRISQEEGRVAEVLAAEADLMKTRAQGEADIEAAKRNLELDIDQQKRDTENYIYKLNRDIDSIRRAVLAYEMDVADYRLKTERQIADERRIQAAANGGGGLLTGDITGQQITKATQDANKFTGIANQCAEAVKSFYNSLGVELPGVTAWADTVRKAGVVMTDFSKIKPGDIVAKGKPGDTSHVGVFTGGDNVFHQSANRGRKAGNFPDLGYFKQGGYFVRPSGMMGQLNDAGSQIQRPAVPTPSVSGVGGTMAAHDAKSAGIRKEAVALQEKLNELQEEAAVTRLQEIARGPIDLQQRKDAVQFATADLNVVKAVSTEEQERLALEAQSAVKLQIRLDRDKEILDKTKLQGVEREKLVESLAEGVEIAKQQIELDTQLLILAQQTRAEKEAAAIQAQIGVTGTGLQAGFVGAAGSAFESEMLTSGNTAQATQLAELTNQLTLAQVQAQGMESSVLAIGDAFGTAMTSGVASLVAGTATAEQVFAQFLSSIGQALLDAAGKMIATYIAIGIARIFAGMGGGDGNAASKLGSNPNVAAYSPLAKGGTFANGIATFAKGGTFSNSIVSSPTLFKFADGGTTRTGLMGEAGPEAIMPLKRGADGSLGVQANGLRDAMNQDRAGGSGSPVLNMSFQSTSINGTEYVSRDQLEQAMEQTRRDASRDGAKRGMTMTLDKLQQSPSTRSRVGMR